MRDLSKLTFNQMLLIGVVASAISGGCLAIAILALIRIVSAP